MSDWTDYYDRELVIRSSNGVIEDLILKIYERKLPIYENLSLDELSFLLRSPIHTGTNIFIERLLRVSCERSNVTNMAYPKVCHKAVYYNTIYEGLMAYYHDFGLNYDLLRGIQAVLGRLNISSTDKEMELTRPQESFLSKRHVGFAVTGKQLLKRLLKLWVKFIKPKIVGEYSYWMRQFLMPQNLLEFDYGGQKYEVDYVIRERIKICCKDAFSDFIKTLLKEIDDKQKEALTEIYADFIDHILPLSIVEGFRETYQHYEYFIRNWKIKQVHSFNGYYWNEFFKIFAIFARRKGAVLVCHVHGIDNFQKSIRTIHNELPFVDYYVTWGKANSDWMKGSMNGKQLDHVKILPLGSTYLFNIKKWTKKKIDPEKITVFYPSGPVMNFIVELQEISREKSYQHKLNVLTLLKELWKLYPNLKLLYKPFPETYDSDPIKDILAREFKEGKIEHVVKVPRAMFYKVDIVIWDSISTGFAESIQSGCPVLVFQAQYEYENLLPLGKELNDELMKCNMLFRDIKSGLKSFEKVIFSFPEFIKKRTEPVRRFQYATAYPRSKRDFRRDIRLALQGL